MSYHSIKNKTIARQSEMINNSIDDFLIQKFTHANKIELDLSYIVNPLNGKSFIDTDQLEHIAPEVIKQHRLLKQQQGDCLDGNIPMLATSLALTWTAWAPALPVTNVTGSALRIKKASPKSITAQSSPSFGPMKTLGSSAPFRPMSFSSRPWGSLPGLRGPMGGLLVSRLPCFG